MYVYQIVHWPSQRAIPKCFFELRTVALIFIKKKKRKERKKFHSQNTLKRMIYPCAALPGSYF